MADLWRSLVSRIVLSIITIYRTVLRPVLPTACRHYPSCSQYAEEAVKMHGAVLGSWMALKRIGRCHPLSAGGYDPVPERMKTGG